MLLNTKCVEWFTYVFLWSTQIASAYVDAHRMRDTFYHKRHPFDKRRRRTSCAKCGQEGHVYRGCTQPITSFGIIAIRRVSDSAPLGPVIRRHPQTCQVHALSAPDQIPSDSGGDEGKVSYLMVQRKDTMGYIDFIRGRWPEDDPTKQALVLQTYLEEMTCEERARLKTLDFETLWNLTWTDHASRIYMNEFVEAKRKFDGLDIQQWLQKTKCSWTEQEYGFPKGRKNMGETNLECARREFKEETGYGYHQYRLVSDFQWVESFVGTNGIPYRHIYFVAELLCDSGPPKIPLEQIRDQGEISNMAWFTYEQCCQIMRPYDTAKKELLSAVHRRYGALQ